MNMVKVYQVRPMQWLLVAASFLLMGVLYYDGLEYMIDMWSRSKEYGHGFLIPVISAFLVWQKKDQLEELEFGGSWLGLLVLVAGCGLYFLGELSTLYIVVQYAFLVALWGFVAAWLGWTGARLIWAPLFFLVFMIPLPNFLYQGLSAQLQLISSELGVAVIRLFDISVYLEGNVIDLGAYKLQVVEACSGLRYLFPLTSLAFLAAYLFNVESWKRVIVFLSSIPITILMNSFRIGVIGVLVEYWGVSMAEGFLHDFEGWVVFMGCAVVLFGEMWLLTRVGKKQTLSEVFAIDFPEGRADGSNLQERSTPVTLYASVVVMALAVTGATMLDDREQVSPARMSFASFPAMVNGWQGYPDNLETIYLDALKLDDYILMDYRNHQGNTVNFYSAYYSSQIKGESVHSPRSCIPGGGWKIASLVEQEMQIQKSKTIKYNRLIIKKGEHKQLVYYWFHGRGRTITNEYLAKWYLFVDSLTRNRSDGALVRFTTYIAPGENIEDGDRRIQSLIKGIAPKLSEYIPG